MMPYSGATKSRCKLPGYPLHPIFWKKKPQNKKQPKPFETETPRKAIFSSGFQQEHPFAFQHEDLSHQLHHLLQGITEPQNGLGQKGQ